MVARVCKFSSWERRQGNEVDLQKTVAQDMKKACTQAQEMAQP